MTCNVAGEVSNVVSITVTYNPDLNQLQKQLFALPVESCKLIIDNASNKEIRRGVEELVRRLANVRLIKADRNLGLAAAVNLGASEIADSYDDSCFVLLMDQDSEPQPKSISRLVTAYQRLIDAGENVGCVGPHLLDADSGISHGFHQATRWRWLRRYADVDDEQPLQCASLNGGGTLIRLGLFQSLNGLDESLFIDHVDTEWSFRVRAAGFSLWGVPNSVFLHRMGESVSRFWFIVWHVWPVRTPLRHYYLFRNAIVLIRRGYVPRVWKVWAVAKLCATLLLTSVMGPNRLHQVRSMWRGIWEGSTHFPRSS